MRNIDNGEKGGSICLPDGAPTGTPLLVPKNNCNKRIKAQIQDGIGREVLNIFMLRQKTSRTNSVSLSEFCHCNFSSPIENK